MGVKLMEFGIYMRKGVVFTIRGCFRSVWNHPFLVFVLCAFIYMSRSYPYIFTLLVSASPLLVCTAVLLGALLFYGQPSVPETEIEKKMKHEAVSLKNGVSNDGNVVEKNESFCAERYREDKKDEVDKLDVKSDLLVNKVDKIRVGGGDALSKERRSVGNESENSETWEANEELEEQKSEWNEERLGDGESMVDHYAIISKVMGELLESESEHEESDGSKSEEADSSDSERENVDSPSHAAWKQVQRHKDEDASDSGSNGAESSSPDASIDDIMPMLDELHPLLDEDAAHPVQMSRVGSEAALIEQSPGSSLSSSTDSDSGEETEIHDSEAADDDEDEALGNKEDQTKPIITWTEEDQKNLMDVGSSEIERNQRLERILRRRKNLSMVPEINLIDFENPDFQFNIAPISTARRNPFDLPHDPYDNSAPGSAPSILLQRSNPFDIPYDSSEENPDEFGEELRPSQSRQPFLRRRDNFSARPSIFSPNRQERLPVRLRPFFVAEQMVAKESSGMNSAVETESVSSVEYIEDEGQSSAVGKNYSSSSSFSDAHSKHEAEAPTFTCTSHCNHHGETVAAETSNSATFYDKAMNQLDEVQKKAESTTSMEGEVVMDEKLDSSGSGVAIEKPELQGNGEDGAVKA